MTQIVSNKPISVTPTESSSEQTLSLDSINSERLREKAEWLTQKIDMAIEDTGQKRRKNQKKATYIKITVTVLSGLATILLGLQITGFEKYFKDIAFVFSAIVTLLTAVEPFFNFRALWVEHERARYKFYRLKDELGFYLAGTKPEMLSPESLNEFHQKYQEIWVNLSEAWLEQRQSSRYNI